MKANWKSSISVRFNGGMLVILITLFMMTGLSFWMMDKFNMLSSQVSQKHVPELSKASDLHLAIKNVHRKMDALKHVQSKAGNRVLVQELIDQLQQITIAINSISIDKYSQLMAAMTKELMPIVNSYSLEVDTFITNKNTLRKQTELLDKYYLGELLMLKEQQTDSAGELNQIYTSARSLAGHKTSFLFKNAANQTLKTINHLKAKQQSSTSDSFFDVVTNPQNGIIAILKKQNEVSVNLSVLQTQTNVIIEQLIAISFDKVNIVKALVKGGTEKLNTTSGNFTKALVSIVLFTTLFTLTFMYVFHRAVSKRLIRIADSLGIKEDQEALRRETQSTSEISIIAKSILKYIIRNEQQNAEIKANVKQLMLIIENSNQAVIIYSEDKIVYCNHYCEQLLDVNAMSNTDIISQNLLIAINTMTYKDRLNVGPYVFRFFATDIDWDGKQSTLALLIDITIEVKKENQLMKTLELVKDESLTDTLTGLYNRRKLELFIEQQVDMEYALIIADIDWFKAFNDFYGHAEGDVCITKVAMAIKESLRTDDDLAVRYGGEEFLVLLINSNMSQAELVADRIQSIIYKFDIKHEKSKFNHLSLSLGIAHSSEIAGDDWQALFEIADKRLYQAKENGRARIVSTGERISFPIEKPPVSD
jgi:diguanylate cyclase (GGDEF)-like protein